MKFDSEVLGYLERSKAAALHVEEVLEGSGVTADAILGAIGEEAIGRRYFSVNQVQDYYVRVFDHEKISSDYELFKNDPSVHDLMISQQGWEKATEKFRN